MRARPSTPAAAAARHASSGSGSSATGSAHGTGAPPRTCRLRRHSAHTAAEIRRCFDRDARVIHPPVRTAYFTPDAGVERGSHWLIVTALEPYKRVDLAIDAAALAGRRLIIVGGGSQRADLERHADEAARRHGAPRAEFTGRVPDDRLRAHYQAAAAFLFPQIEDFGITAVEAQACGCPVLARRGGGALDSVIDGETGAFFDGDAPAAMASAAKELPSDAAAACRRNAERFSEAAFDTKMRGVIAEALGTSNRPSQEP